MNLTVENTKTAFVPKRLINENITLSHELGKDCRRKGISPRCMLKIDMQKAYWFSWTCTDLLWTSPHQPRLLVNLTGFKKYSSFFTATANFSMQIISTLMNGGKGGPKFRIRVRKNTTIFDPGWLSLLDLQVSFTLGIFVSSCSGVLSPSCILLRLNCICACRQRLGSSSLLDLLLTYQYTPLMGLTKKNSCYICALDHEVWLYCFICHCHKW